MLHEHAGYGTCSIAPRGRLSEFAAPLPFLQWLPSLITSRREGEKSKERGHNLRLRSAESRIVPCHGFNTEDPKVGNATLSHGHLTQGTRLSVAQAIHPVGLWPTAITDCGHASTLAPSTPGTRPPLTLSPVRSPPTPDFGVRRPAAAGRRCAMDKEDRAAFCSVSLVRVFRDWPNPPNLLNDSE